MKKVLAVVLAMITLFSMFAFSSAAEDESYVAPDIAVEYYESLKKEGVIKEDQVIIAFDLLNTGAKFKYPVSVYDNKGNFTNTQDVSGVYYMIPNNKDLSSSGFMTPGSYVILPSVIAPAGKDFKGWKYTDFAGNSRIMAAGSYFEIPQGADSVGVLRFTAIYVTGEIEGDIFDTLISVFISVAGKLFELLNIDIDISGLLGGLL